MYPNDIVVNHVQGDRERVVLDLLGKDVRQTGEPAHVHSHVEVLTLDVGMEHINSARSLRDNGEMPLPTMSITPRQILSA